MLRLDPRISDRVISALSRVVIGLMSRSLMLLEDPASGMGAPAHILGALARLPAFRPFSDAFLSPLSSPTPPAGYLTFVSFGFSVYF